MESFFELKKEGLGECMSDKNRVVLVLKTNQISAIRKRLAGIFEQYLAAGRNSRVGLLAPSSIYTLP